MVDLQLESTCFITFKSNEHKAVKSHQILLVVLAEIMGHLVVDVGQELVVLEI